MKILTVVGARPQFIKAAVLSRLIRHQPDLEECMVHTGQHYDYNMSEVFFQELEIPAPAYNLGIGSGNHGTQTGKMMISLEEVVLDEKPDVLLVYGDTNSTLAGAMVAAKLHIPVAHVEAGLRSFNKAMPEELNRIATDHVSNWLFCPTETAVKNLHNENIREGVVQSGDVMYDSVLFYGAKSSDILDRLSLEAGDYCLATVHRAENTDAPTRLRNIFEAMAESGLQILLPLHPRTKKALEREGITPAGNISITDPVSYLDIIHLQKNARLILTDSGGIQKEAFFWGKGCITLRDETEWVETVDAGYNRLTGADKGKILAALEDFSLPAAPEALYGDGNAGEAILAHLKA